MSTGSTRLAWMAAATAMIAGVASGGQAAGRDGRFQDPPENGVPGDRCAIWFVGSSSIHRWTTLSEDMKPWHAYNRGADGLTIRSTTARLAGERGARPQGIVFYGGENDIAYGMTSAEALRDLRRFLVEKTRLLGPVPVVMIGVKPGSARWNQRSVQADYNRAARAIAAADPTVAFIDPGRRLLRGGRPGPFYMGDGIHMNPAGYAIWAKAVRRSLAATLPGRIVRACTARGRTPR